VGNDTSGHPHATNSIPSAIQINWKELPSQPGRTLRTGRFSCASPAVLFHRCLPIPFEEHSHETFFSCRHDACDFGRPPFFGGYRSNRFAPIHFYSLYDGTGTAGSYPSGGFHDIEVGCDGLYCAAPGWDYTTGPGSFWISQMYGVLK